MGSSTAPDHARILGGSALVEAEIYHVSDWVGRVGLCLLYIYY
jgi:hypothetical protein